MHGLEILRDLVILVAVAIPVVAVAQRFKVPSVVGFLLTGMALGPRALGLIPQAESVAGLAELGVLLLLFAIGLELSLTRIIKIGALVLQAGGLQVGGTIVVVGGLFAAFGRPISEAVLLGGLVALSSTAVVLKVYADRGELDTPHGRVAMAILLFQDFAIIPLIALMPLLGSQTGESPALADLLRMGGSLVALTLLVVIGRWAVPWVLERIVGLRNRELFTLCIGFFGLSAAYVTSTLGLSLAIGAFMAGLIISESEYGAQALSDVLPFRDMFSGIFFISVGMLLDLEFVAAHVPMVLGAALGVLIIKTVVVVGVGRIVRRSLEVSLVAGFGLAQIGEFSFVLASVAEPYGLIDADTYQLFLSASVLSMLATPFVITGARPLAETLVRARGRAAVEVMPHEKRGISQLSDHAIIIGYGLAGRHLARVLRAAGFSYVILEQNGQLVRTGRQAGEPLFFGDGTRREVLERVHIERARVLVFSISSPADERRGVAVAREQNPALPIIVRTRYVAAIDELRGLGATDVVVEEFEAALELFAKVLERYQIPMETVREEVEAVRGETYGLLRGAQPTADIRVDPLYHLRVHDALEIVDVAETAQAVDESPLTLDLRRKTGAVIIAVVRAGEAFYTPDPTFRFEPLDTVVLVGDPDALDRARKLFQSAPTTGSV